MSPRPVVIGVPVLNRYDLLLRLIESIEKGIVHPGGGIHVVDNGGRMPEYLERFESATAGLGLGHWKRKEADPPRSVAASWNHILRSDPGADVVLVNDDVILAPDGLARLLARPEPLVLAPDCSCFLHRPEATRAIGYYDETFSPAYFEDNDYMRRALLAGVPIARVDGVTLPSDGSQTRAAMTELERHALDQDFEKNKRYFENKWGGLPGHETFSVPFDGRQWKEGTIMGIGPQTSGELAYEVGRAIHGPGRRVTTITFGGSDVRLAATLETRTRGEWMRWCVGTDISSRASDACHVIMKTTAEQAMRTIPKGRFDLVIVEKDQPVSPHDIRSLVTAEGMVIRFGKSGSGPKAATFDVAGGVVVSLGLPELTTEIADKLPPWELHPWLAEVISARKSA